MPHNSGSKPLLMAWSFSHFVGVVLGFVVHVPLFLLSLSFIAVIGGLIYFPASMYLALTSKTLPEDSFTAEELRLSGSDMIAGFFGLPPMEREPTTTTTTTTSSSSSSSSAASVSATAASGVAPETSDGVEENTPAVLLRFQELHATTPSTPTTLSTNPNPTTEALPRTEIALRQSPVKRSVIALRQSPVKRSVAVPQTAAPSEQQVASAPATPRAQSMRRLYQQQESEITAPPVAVKSAAGVVATDATDATDATVATATTAASTAGAENSKPKDVVFTPAQQQLLARLATNQARLAPEQEQR